MLRLKPRPTKITLSSSFEIETDLLFSALFAVAADFGAGHGDFDAAVFFDLFFQLFVERGLEFADRPHFRQATWM